MEAEQRIRAVRIRVWSGCCGEVLLDRKGALGIICGYLGFFVLIFWELKSYGTINDLSVDTKFFLLFKMQIP